MHTWLYLLVFLFGLATGSFLNSVIYRLEIQGSFLKGRSFCPHCKHLLPCQDLVPVLSFLYLKGRCRYCSQKISWQYPLVELATGVLFVLTVYQFYPVGAQDLLTIGYWLLAIGFLIVIFVYDLKHYIIPDKIVYSAIGITFLYQLLMISDFNALFNPLLSAIVALSFFLTVVLFSRGRWMGMGDVKLAFLMGLLLSFPNILVALFLAFFSGAIIGLGLIASGKKTLKSEVPFGPFLIGGTFAALFWGDQIISWYLNLL